jgi:sugar phosphate isomerase/epimerase
MTLSISNIIWKKGKENFENFLKVVSKNGVKAVELSLNSIFEEPLSMTENEFSWLNEVLNRYKISISALHSLTYTRPDLEIFNSKEKREELIKYIFNYIDIAKKLNTNNLVYGSPKSRKTYSYTLKEANCIFLEFLKEIDDYSEDINFNIEPLPQTYCEYLNTFEESVYLLKKTNFKNIFIQVDIRSIIENEENIDTIFQNTDYIKHVHIGEPNLAMLDKSEYSHKHKTIFQQLSHIGYNGFLSIEVINHQEKDYKKYTETIIKRAREYYEKK